MRLLPLVISILFALSVPGLAAPRLIMVSPTEGQVVDGKNVEVSVSYNTNSEEEVTYIELEIDGQRVDERNFDEPRTRGICSFIWNTDEYENGKYYISVKVYSDNGLLGTVSSEHEVANRPPDTTPPVIEYLNVSSGQFLAGKVELEIRATDDSGEPPLVSLAINGTLKFLKNTPPYDYVWDTTSYNDGEHVIEAWAVDASDNQTVATALNVLVKNRTEAVQSAQVMIPEMGTTAEAETAHPTPAIPTEIEALSSAPARVADPSWTGGAAASVTVIEKSSEPLVRFIEATPTDYRDDAIAWEPESIEIAKLIPPPVQTLPEPKVEVARAPMELEQLALGTQLAMPEYLSPAIRSLPGPELVEGPTGVRVGLLPTDGYRTTPAKTAEPIQYQPKIRYAITSNTDVPTGKLQVEMYGKRFAVDVEVTRGVPVVPLRQVWNHVNGPLLWRPDKRMVTGFSRMVDVEIKIGSKDAIVNDVSVFMPIAPYVENGVTMVPLAFLQYAFRMDLEFDDKVGNYILAVR